MHLQRATDIALRVLMLTTSRPEHWTVDDLAAAANTSANHTAKVVQRLAAMGLVVTTRGRTGGVRSTDAALTASVGGVVRAFEGAAPGSSASGSSADGGTADGGTAEVVDCEGTACPLRSGCRLRHALRDAQEAFFASLDPISLHDLTRAPTGPLLLTLTRSDHAV